MRDLERALTKLDCKDGDFVFFDLNAIETTEIQALVDDPPDSLVGVIFIGVHTRRGQTTEDAVFAMSKMELDLLTADKA